MGGKLEPGRHLNVHKADEQWMCDVITRQD